MTRWLRYSKTFFNLISKQNPLFLHKLELFSLFKFAEQLQSSSVGALSLPDRSKPRLLMSVFRALLRLQREKITLFSLHVDSKWHQDIENTLFLSLSCFSKHNSHSTFTPYIVPAHISYYPSVPLFPACYQLIHHWCKQHFSGLWSCRLLMRIVIYTFSLPLQAHHQCGWATAQGHKEVQFTNQSCSSVLLVTNQSCTDQKWNQPTESNSYEII